VTVKAAALAFAALLIAAVAASFAGAAGPRTGVGAGDVGSTSAGGNSLAVTVEDDSFVAARVAAFQARPGTQLSRGLRRAVYATGRTVIFMPIATALRTLR